VREILQYAKDETHYDDLFQYNLERVIAALTDLVAQH